MNNFEREAAEVLDLLENHGYALGKSAINGKFWAQEKSLGSGGISKNVALGTIELLERKGKIVAGEENPRLPQVYSLK